MIDDYRNTQYCQKLGDISKKKEVVKSTILAKHPKENDLHKYISRNYEPFKKQFVEAYNGKCSYCGVSIDIISLKMFEIDHFIPQKSDCFASKADAGYIENLVLACYNCNRAKRDFKCPEADLQKVHPDGTGITSSFVRGDDYCIRINDKMKEDETVIKFYKQVNLDNPIHRLDYLLMNMRGLSKKIEDNHPSYGVLMKAIELLQQKRNMM